jgi:hypothetical protein
MNIDNVTIFWALFLVAVGLMGVMISFMYFASKKSKK